LNPPLNDTHYHCVYHLEGGQTMQVAKWGNSLATRLPVTVVKALQLRICKQLDIIANTSNLVCSGFKPVDRCKCTKPLRGSRPNCQPHFITPVRAIDPHLYP
jgi:hypothetical protein